MLTIASTAANTISTTTNHNNNTESTTNTTTTTDNTTTTTTTTTNTNTTAVFDSCNCSVANVGEMTAEIIEASTNLLNEIQSDLCAAITDVVDITTTTTTTEKDNNNNTNNNSNNKESDDNNNTNNDHPKVIDNNDDDQIIDDDIVSDDDDNDIPNNNHNKEEDDDDDDDEENLDDLLANMDIDKDFTEIDADDDNDNDDDGNKNNDNKTVTTKQDEKKQHNNNNNNNNNNNSNEVGKDNELLLYEQRLERDEVFSKRYTLSKEEFNEIKQLETLLCIHKLPIGNNGGGVGDFFRRTSSNALDENDATTTTTNNNNTEGNKDDETKQTTKKKSEEETSILIPLRDQWNSIVHPIDIRQKVTTSILLRKGFCTIVGIGNCELYLFPRGIIIATVKEEQIGLFRKSTVLTRTFYKGMLFSRIDFVTICDDMTSNGIKNSTLQFDLKDGIEQSMFVSFQSEEERTKWLNSIRKTVLYYHMTNNTNTTTNNKTTAELGWQYQYVYTPLYTLACTTYPDPHLSNHTIEQINTLDQYNGYSPLHYAVKYNHIPAIKSLLEIGADPNIVATDKIQTPMYIAVQEELPNTTISLLEQYGSKSAKHYTQLEKKGALFGKINITNQIISNKREIAEEEEKKKQLLQQEQTEIVTNQMSNNMQKLRERGEQIEELANKASALNDGASEYASLAKQLKEKMMNKQPKKWYQLR